MKELILAAYDREYSWISKLNSDVKVTVYRKGTSLLGTSEILIEPNLGRDVHTFFYHLYHRYDSLSEITFFSQDYPFDHVNNYIELLNGGIELWNLHAKQYTDNCWFFCTQYGVISCNKFGAPHHPGLSIETMWNKLFDHPCPEELFFTPTGHFAITKKGANSIPRDFYKKILDILESEITSPWETERLEPYIFLR